MQVAVTRRISSASDGATTRVGRSRSESSVRAVTYAHHIMIFEQTGYPPHPRHLVETAPATGYGSDACALTGARPLPPQCLGIPHTLGFFHLGRSHA